MTICHISSARQPLVVAPPPRGEVPLIRKLQQAMPRERASTATMNNRQNAPLGDIAEEEAAVGENDHRRRELESQKARIVAQMVPHSSTGNNLNMIASGIVTGGGNAYGVSKKGSTSTLGTSRPASVARTNPIVTDENVPPTGAASTASLGSSAVMTTMAPPPAEVVSKKKSSIIIPVVDNPSRHAKAYDVFANTLTLAFRAYNSGKLFRDPSEYSLFVGKELVVD